MKNRKLLLTSRDIETIEGERRVHFLNPKADRIRKSLGDHVGLKNLGVHLVYIEPGSESTEFHKHYTEEECVFVLSGKGTLYIGDEIFPFGEGDFVGFPVDTDAHMIVNDGEEILICLVMGQRLTQDVADYPHKNKRLYRYNGKWDLVDLEAITDPRKPA